MEIFKNQSYKNEMVNCNVDKITFLIELNIKKMNETWNKFLVDNQENIENWKEFINK